VPGTWVFTTLRVTCVVGGGGGAPGGGGGGGGVFLPPRGFLFLGGGGGGGRQARGGAMLVLWGGFSMYPVGNVTVGREAKDRPTESLWCSATRSPSCVPGA